MSGIKTILVADDDASMLQILTDKLSSEGFKVIPAKDGEEALNKTLSLRPDLVLLDLLMPKISGLEVMKKIRDKDEWGKALPIFLVTNVDPDDDTISKVNEAKPSYYMMKGSFSFEDLIVKIKQELKV